LKKRINRHPNSVGCGDIVTECCKAKEDSEIEDACSACKKIVRQWVCAGCGWDMNNHMLIT